MPTKTVFISSTFEDLKEHRRAVWDALKTFDVAIRGMEEFGARTTTPVATCLAEVEQSDVYVGIAAYRLGSVEPVHKRPFTMLEYETAYEQGKEILIYLADDNIAIFPHTLTDSDPKARATLEAFKKQLRERHTVNSFSTPKDLADKLRRDFSKRFTERATSADPLSAEVEFAKTASTLKAFRLTPKQLNGTEVRLGGRFYGRPFPASRELCKRFNLEYGAAVGAGLVISHPKDKEATEGLTELYATGPSVEDFLRLIETKSFDGFVQLLFTEDDVRRTRGEFVGRTYYDGFDDGEDEEDARWVYIPAEGRVIMLFTKSA